MTREITLDDIESLAVGSWILGTGGGGSPYLGLLNMRQLYAAGACVRLLPPDALDDDDLIAVVSNMGAPLVGQERLTDSANIARAVELMEDGTLAITAETAARLRVQPGSRLIYLQLHKKTDQLERTHLPASAAASTLEP